MLYIYIVDVCVSFRFADTRYFACHIYMYIFFYEAQKDSFFPDETIFPNVIFDITNTAPAIQIRYISRTRTQCRTQNDHSFSLFPVVLGKNVFPRREGKYLKWKYFFMQYLLAIV